MNSSELKSVISIEFGLNMVEAGNIVDCIFENIIECFRNNKNLEIERFGKFKIIEKKDPEDRFNKVSFIPSGKLAKRINYNFDELRETELQIGKYPVDETPMTSAELEKKFLNEGIISGDAETKNPVIQRKLISDDVVKLHREITEEEKKPVAKNIWG